MKVITAARKIDEIIGIDTVGSWEDQEIVQGIVEPAGIAVEYGDHTSIPLTSWNASFQRRTIVRGELGLLVGTLEEGRASAIRLNSAGTSVRRRLSVWKSSAAPSVFTAGRRPGQPHPWFPE
ncbi:major head protein [Pseudomonas phage WP1]